MTLNPRGAEGEAAYADVAASSPDLAAEAEGVGSRDLPGDPESLDTLLQEADKAELRMALHDLAEGVRGLIRVAPLSAVLGGVAFGLLMGRRKSRPAARRRA